MVAPAIVLIMIRTLAGQSKMRELSASASLVIACSASSSPILQADADVAEGGRKAAAELIASHVARGEQGGFYRCAQEAGATIANPTKRGQRMEGGAVTHNRFPMRDLIDSRHSRLPHRRTMGHGGGPYGHPVGLPVLVWKPETTIDCELWRIW